MKFFLIILTLFCTSVYAQDQDAMQRFLINPSNSNLRQDISGQTPTTIGGAYEQQKQLRLLQNFENARRSVIADMLIRYENRVKNDYPELQEEWDETLEKSNSPIMGVFFFLMEHPEIKMPIDRARDFSASYRPKGGFKHDKMVAAMMRHDPEAARAYIKEVRSRRNRMK